MASWSCCGYLLIIRQPSMGIKRQATEDRTLRQREPSCQAMPQSLHQHLAPCDRGKQQAEMRFCSPKQFSSDASVYKWSYSTAPPQALDPGVAAAAVQSHDLFTCALSQGPTQHGCTYTGQCRPLRKEHQGVSQACKKEQSRIKTLEDGRKQGRALDRTLGFRGEW